MYHGTVHVRRLCRLGVVGTYKRVPFFRWDGIDDGFKCVFELTINVDVGNDEPIHGHSK